MQPFRGEPWSRVRQIALTLRERARSMGHGELPLFLVRTATELEAAADDSVQRENRSKALCKCGHPYADHLQGSPSSEYVGPGEECLHEDAVMAEVCHCSEYTPERRCSVCTLPQWESPGGWVCGNGHGGAPSMDELMESLKQTEDEINGKT